MTLADVSLFRVPQTIIERTEIALRSAGVVGDERFVLWSGRQTGRTFQILTEHIPEQTPFHSEGGIGIYVDGAELHQLNRALYETSEVLAVQVHAHPGDAYHSATDDTYAIVSTIGGLSVVVPNFCRGSLVTPQTAVYRLLQTGWVRQPVQVIEVT